MRKDLEILEKSIGKEYQDTVPSHKEEEKPPYVISKMWGVSGTARFGIEAAIPQLEPGTYEAVMTLQGPMLFKKEINSDELLDLPDDTSQEIFDSIKQFWGLKDRFKERGFLHKRGILAFGPQGGGKTTLMFKLIKNIVEHNGVAFLSSSPYAVKACLEMTRSIEPTLPILVCLEDIDDIVCSYGDRALTSLLDGDANTNNVLYFATTNYPERLPARLVNRPSRFDVVKYIGLPSEESRKIYLKAKAQELSPSTLSVWVEKTVNFSIPQLKELIISVLGFGVDLDIAITRIRNMSIGISSTRFETPGKE